MIVVDASAVVAALVDGGPEGEWAAEVLSGSELAAPHLMPVEVANILRRAALAKDVTDDAAAQAYHDLLDLNVRLYPFEPFAARIWQLRQTVTAYDAWYVALAEAIGGELVTLDERLARAPGVTCAFRTPAAAYRNRPTRPRKRS